ncbi:MAG: hypothetical protein KDJ65_36905 [Anaerolineae bacterium]|nr:hypothetical protein [Anaerolineae bacterium]
MTAGTLTMPFLGLSGNRKSKAKKVDSAVAQADHEGITESMSEKNQHSDEPPIKADNLQQIVGVGPSTANVLNSVGIYRFAQLANLTPEGLANLLKEKLPSISARRIKQGEWLKQAKNFAQSQISEPDNADDTSKSQDDFDPVQMDSDTPAPSESKLRSKRSKRSEKSPQGKWRELANFFVSFGYVIEEDGSEQLQTKVHNTQANQEAEGTWNGVAIDPLVDWILTQADLDRPPTLPAKEEAHPESDTVVSQSLAPDEYDVIVELSNLWVSELKESVRIGHQPSAQFLRAESRLTLSSNTIIEQAFQHLSFRVELYLVDIQMGSSTFIDSFAGRLRPEQFDYEIQQDFPVPPVGQYQLYLVARILPPGRGIAQLQGPLVKVEA